MQILRSNSRFFKKKLSACVGQGHGVFCDLPVSPCVFLKELLCCFSVEFHHGDRCLLLRICHQLENKTRRFQFECWFGNWTPRLAQGNVNTDRSKRQSAGTNIGINSTFHHDNRPVAKRKETQRPMFHREECRYMSQHFISLKKKINEIHE